jgi:uncharacterized protein (TIGR02117 family)
MTLFHSPRWLIATGRHAIFTLVQLCLFSGLLALSACASLPPRLPCPPAPRGDVVYLIERGWHTGIAIPVSELDANLSFYRGVYPGARVILFGYGKKTFFTVRAKNLSDYLLGPWPGPAAIQTVGLRVPPSEAYGPEEVSAIALPPGGRQALSAYIWNDLVKDAAGKPEILAKSTHPAGIFYAAHSEYSPLHTCNTWTAGALHAAGLSISEKDVVFSSQVRARVEKATNRECSVY